MWEVSVGLRAWSGSAAEMQRGFALYWGLQPLNPQLFPGLVLLAAALLISPGRPSQDLTVGTP